MIISLIGIIVAVAIFILMAFKRYNILLNTIVASIIIMVTSQLPVVTTMKTVYMAGFGAFMKGYFLLFILSAIFGKLMSDSGAARSIALMLAKLVKKSKNNQQFFTVLILPIFYFALSYAGVSAFVLVFTVISIGRELFEECDVPWKYYCYGSAGIFPAIVLGGSLYSTNIIATEGYGVAPTAGMSLSIILCAVIWIVLALLIKLDMNKLAKTNEGFLPSGAPIKQLQIAEQIKEEDLPNPFLSMVPLVIPIIMIILFSADVLVSLTAASAFVLVAFFKQFKSIKQSLSDGISAAGMPLIYVSGAVGLTTIIKAAPGFEVVVQYLDGLPGVFGGVVMVMLTTAIVASSSSSLPTFLPDISAQMLGAGLSSEIAARLTVVSGFTAMVPHNPGIINAVALTKLDFKSAAWLYFKAMTIPGFVATVVAITLISLGIY